MALVGLATTASAASMPCTPQSTTLTMTAAVYSGGLSFPGSTSGASVVCGDITFSNFQVFDAAPSTSTGSPFVLLSGTYDGSSATLAFNPNLNNASVNQDVHLLFNVVSTSPLITIGLANGGSTSSAITERLCSGSIDPFSGVCSGGTQLASLTAAGGVTTTAVLTVPSTSFNVYKDIGHPAGGEMTGFSQTFTAQTGVPEPATFAMLGGGLLVLALARRKKLA
jgi:hypothetical protein